MIILLVVDNKNGGHVMEKKVLSYRRLLSK